jgi:hypothetical protein
MNYKVLALCVLALAAVAQASFSGSLVQKAQPALTQAMFKVRLAASTSRASNKELQTQIVSALQEQANSLLSQIQTAVTAGQEIAQSVVSQLSETYAQLQALGSNVVSNGQAILSNLLSNIWSIFGSRNQRFLSGLVDWVSNISVTDILNQVAGYATALVNQLNVESLLQLALGSVLPQPIANLIVNQLTAANRGVFGDLWTSISNGASEAWNQIVDFASVVGNVASSAFSNVQQLASEFVSSALNEASTISTQAAQQLLDFIRPYQQDLGVLYDQVVAQVNQIIGN